MPFLNAKVRGYSAVPYGGSFVLNTPERGMVGVGTDMNALLVSVRAWRNANAFPVGLDFEREVEREVCLNYPGECKETDPRVPDAVIRISWSDVIVGTRHLASFVAAGRPLVSPEEANARSATCLACAFKGHFTTPCTADCTGLSRLVEELVGGAKTVLDARLNNLACRVCKCSVRAIVWVPLKYQTPHLTSLQRQQYALAKELHGCWKAD